MKATSMSSVPGQPTGQVLVSCRRPAAYLSAKNGQCPSQVSSLEALKPSTRPAFPPSPNLTPEMNPRSHLCIRLALVGQDLRPLALSTN